MNHKKPFPRALLLKWAHSAWSLLGCLNLRATQSTTMPFNASLIISNNSRMIQESRDSFLSLPIVANHVLRMIASSLLGVWRTHCMNISPRYAIPRLSLYLPTVFNLVLPCSNTLFLGALSPSIATCTRPQ
jgi:hypothetical protein